MREGDLNKTTNKQTNNTSPTYGKVPSGLTYIKLESQEIENNACGFI